MKEILLERVDNVVQMRNKNDFKVDDMQAERRHTVR